jgi:zinc transport system substrate-binding protein
LFNPRIQPRCLLLLAFIGFGSQSLADVPSVVADIAPVHSLVSLVMRDVASPALLVKGNASPHEFSLRPSTAQHIAQADIIFSVSAELTPWLGSAVDNLARDAQQIALLEVDGVNRLSARTDALFAAHSDQGEGDVNDPHAWLDPNNAMKWLDAIALALSDHDTANASIYKQNAAIAKIALESTRDELTQMLTPLAGQPFMVFHDSFQYFEQLFDLNAIGAISASDAVRPGPARVDHVRRLVKDQQIKCMLSEPSSNTKLVNSVAPSAEMTVVTIDVLGAQLEPGAGLYNTMMLELGKSLEKCLR